MPKFSVIIPCYNAARTLPQTLASFAAQTEPDWEAILIDDGSTDATAGILHSAARRDPRIRVYRNPGKGPSAARNFGVRQAQAPLVAFCDADDRWHAAKLARMRDLFADPATDAAYARIAFFEGARSRTLSTVPPGPLTLNHLLGENPVCTMSNITLRRDVFLASGGLREDLVQNEDLEWLIRLVGAGSRIIGLPETLVQYRTSFAGLSADLDRMRAGRRAALDTARQFGHAPARRHEAIYLRYLARRALRTGAPVGQALRLTFAGLSQSPAGWFSDLRRGALTLFAVLSAPLLPAALRRRAFAH